MSRISGRMMGRCGRVKVSAHRGSVVGAAEARHAGKRVEVFYMTPTEEKC